jgi:hypothetical protein
VGAAQGTRPVISLPRQPGDGINPRALAVDAAGNLYVADVSSPDYKRSRIQKRDAQGNWSVIPTQGTDAYRRALAADAVGNLYVRVTMYTSAR